MIMSKQIIYATVAITTCKTNKYNNYIDKTTKHAIPFLLFTLADMNC